MKKYLIKSLNQEFEVPEKVIPAIESLEERAQTLEKELQRFLEQEAEIVKELERRYVDGHTTLLKDVSDEHRAKLQKKAHLFSVDLDLLKNEVDEVEAKVKALQLQQLNTGSAPAPKNSKYSTGAIPMYYTRH